MESCLKTSLEGDDPDSLRLVFDILYQNILGDRIMVEIPEIDVKLDAVVNKYDLAGVRRMISYSREKESMIRATEYMLKNRLNRLEAELRKEKTKPGSVVDYRHRSPNGTRVVNLNKPGQTGTIIANDEEDDTEIGVLWDDGTESHNLKCNKHGINSLLYL
jgi:hypothetical protein